MKMKKTISILTVVIASSAFFMSCDTDFLNTQPQDRVSSEATWADPVLSEAFIFGIYSYLGYGGFEEQALASYTDEAMFTHAGRNINTFTEGTESPSNVAWVSSTYAWGQMYQAIRAANIALEELVEVSWDDAELQERLTGEAYFLRAYYYQQLLRFYGGVPLITEVYGLDSDFSVARNTYEENVNFIVSDLDNAASLLDGKEETDGRATRLAALALKSRVLLYAASDLHDASSPIGTELHKYGGGSQDARWQTALTAAEAALNAGSGYMLGLTAPVSAEEGAANYNAMAMGGGSAVADPAGRDDLIFMRSATSDYTVESNWPLGGLHYGINNGPNGYNNWAGNTPIQQLVDDYEMMDGSQFDWNNPVHAANPFDNRDPRFYATILHDGSDWKPRPASAAGLDPNDQIQTGSYDDGNGGTIPGLDTRDGPIEDWNGSRTHYYTRKFIDPNPALPDNQSNTQVVPWPFIRYTEVVLNYVEALIETGDETTARNWLNQIRFRAGMPATAATGDALVDLYRNERRIELQYEEHRYHDARRWMIPETTVGRGIEILNITATVRTGQTAHVPYRYDPAVYDYTYTVVPNTDNETRVWNNNMYYRVIPRDEMNRNELLEQNPGHTGG